MRSIDYVTRLLLISNSTLHGNGYLDHAEREIRDFVSNTARITQFLEENTEVVVGLREGSLLRVHEGMVTLKGTNAACLFRCGEQPVEAAPGTNLCELLQAPACAPGADA